MGHRLALLTAVAVLSGCATGPRPTLVDAPPVDDPGALEVLNLMGGADAAEFTASYLIFTKFGGATTQAVVTQTGSRRSITVGHIRFLVDGERTATCDLIEASCESGINDAAISDVQVTHQFWSRAMENRLRTDANRSIGPGTVTDYSVAGKTARCVAVPVAGGDKSYCALPSGVLAGYDGADLTIDLVSYEDAADESLLATR